MTPQTLAHKLVARACDPIPGILPNMGEAGGLLPQLKKRLAKT